VLDPAGFTEETSRIRDAFANAEFEAMIATVTDDMVEKLAFAGTVEQVLEQAEPFPGVCRLAAPLLPVFLRRSVRHA
jgi:alkanesulfonate monooxygenase SsuD/methylene tetrahydromethanopterin reductase-like flavin-dependent oxidoreductase (luciferase family)